MSNNTPELFVFVVEGTGRFPYDMLRYDHCWPYDSTDAFHMEYKPSDRSVRRIRLQTYGDRFSVRPTTKRWESFTWRVIEARSR